MILAFALAGLGAAALKYYRTPPFYVSEAKLLVRYVLERSAIDSMESQSNRNNEAGIINSEIEILTSWDLATEVAEALGVERFGPEATEPVDVTTAAGIVKDGLRVSAVGGSNVIVVTYRNQDPKLAADVLQELVKRYFSKHLEVHRSLDAFEFVTQQTDLVRGRLRQTEEELKKLKGEAGILSLDDATGMINDSMKRCQQELLVAETQLAEQQARVNEFEKLLAIADKTESENRKQEASSEKVDASEVQQYQAIVERLSRLRSAELELLGKYEPGNPLVKSTRSQIEELDRQRRRMEERSPALLASVPASGQSTQSGIVEERARLAALVAKVNNLKEQQTVIQKQADRISEVGTRIDQLETEKQAEQENYKYHALSLEKARIDEALDPTKIPNINMVQKPSPPFGVPGYNKKVILGLAGGGLAFGLGLAFLIEIFLDRSVKRPVELEGAMRVPLFLSIPRLADRARPLLGFGDATKSSEEKSIQKAGTHAEVAPWAPSHFIRSYAESIRDRLILWFQLQNLTHKPKLVGVTGVAGGEGTSTLAGSLAASLSETGDGKVLLVDLNSGRSDVHPFLDGQPAFGLTEALEANGTMQPASDNLYMATGASLANDGGPRRLAPKQFYSMIPSLRASHFDYIIFDLPPVSRSSATLAMAGCLDKLLLVVEAEKTDRDQVKRTYSELVNARAKVSAVLNKVREQPGLGN